MRQQYIIPPPNVPEFLYKFNVRVWLDLIYWAKQEHRAWIKYLSENGYYKEYRWFIENVSPIVILAQSPKYRKLCAFLTQSQRVWDSFSVRERVFIRRAFELRDILKR